MMSSQSTIDGENSAFWDTLCGSVKAKQLGVTDRSPASLKKFDDWYLDYYWYLGEHIPFNQLGGSRVLEVGLGYGTVLQRIVETGANYSGLDIAHGPVEMGNYRIRQVGGNGSCTQGSVLECPFPDEEFDYVVAIGCYHHTGDLQRALDETYRVLRPGGRATIMIYYAYSFRRWREFPKSTARQLASEYLRVFDRAEVTDIERRQYDATPDGDAAPETAFTSRRELARMTSQYRHISQRLELLGDGKLFETMGRDHALKTFGRLGGRHIYATLHK